MARQSSDPRGFLSVRLQPVHNTGSDLVSRWPEVSRGFGCASVLCVLCVVCILCIWLSRGLPQGEQTKQQLHPCDGCALVLKRESNREYLGSVAISPSARATSPEVQGDKLRMAFRGNPPPPHRGFLRGSPKVVLSHLKTRVPKRECPEVWSWGL